MRTTGCGRGWVCGCGLLAGVALIVSMSGVAAAATTWEIQASPNVTVPNGQIQAVSCRSVSACTAVGYYLDRAGRYVPLAQTWNGSSWTKQAVPTSAPDPGGYSASSSRPPTEVGTSRPAGEDRPGRHDQTRSNRSRFITLFHAATKSFTNFSFASSLA
jgi:hypothetical protein